MQMLRATNFKDGDVLGVIRIGNDFAGNYYEIKIPLKSYTMVHC
jgi:hypothetical protein